MYEDFIKNEADADETGVRHELPAEFRRQYPNLCYALEGRTGSKKAKAKPQPPASISLRAGNAGVFFTITPQKADRVLQGFVASPGALLDQIEALVANGSYVASPAFRR